MSHYVVINSDKSVEYFPDNTPYHFRTQFQSPLLLNGIWKVALVDINLTTSKMKTKDPLYIYSDICGDNFVDGEKYNFLRMIKAHIF